MWLNLDRRAGVLLAQIDNTVSYDDLFAPSGLPRLDSASFPLPAAGGRDQVAGRARPRRREAALASGTVL
jgi:hypothetical protein